MFGFLAAVICFVAAAKLHAPLSTFAVICGIVQTLSFLLHNSQDSYEARGGQMGSGDLGIMVLLGAAGLIGSAICAFLLFTASGR